MYRRRHSNHCILNVPFRIVAHIITRPEYAVSVLKRCRVRPSVLLSQGQRARLQQQKIS